MASRYRTLTSIGRQVIPVSSRPQNRVAVLAIVTEGDVEEPQYLLYVIGMCRRKFNTNVDIRIVNDELPPHIAKVGSNPLVRLNYLLKWLELNAPDYNPLQSDTAWLVCDRDDGSFSVGQYNKVMKMCVMNNIHFVITNPAFQLWLLLHYTSTINIRELNQYPRSKGKLRKIESILSTYVPNYKHGEINMDDFKILIDAAVLNSQQLPSKPLVLKRTVGTNFSDLMQYIKHVFGIQSFMDII